ncbi:hypothetical protein ACA910_018489 [Epithemia clementina (nom. ined.)]
MILALRPDKLRRASWLQSLIGQVQMIVTSLSSLSLSSLSSSSSWLIPVMVIAILLLLLLLLGGSFYHLGFTKTMALVSLLGLTLRFLQLLLWSSQQSQSQSKDDHDDDDDDNTLLVLGQRLLWCVVPALQQLLQELVGGDSMTMITASPGATVITVLVAVLYFLYILGSVPSS